VRIVVFGAGGMLGKAVCREVTHAGHDPYPYTHAQCDIANRADVKIALGLARQGYDDGVGAVINCAGVTPGPRSIANMVLANSAGPHIIAEEAFAVSARMVHVSTDCVFSGTKPHAAHFKSTDPPTPNDWYGRSKLLGEPSGPHIITVRTSFIGPESGLLAWLLRQPPGEIEGWRNALWTGSTSIAVARRLVEFASVKLPAIDDVGMLIHLATEKAISKYEVLLLLGDAFDVLSYPLKKGLVISPVDEPRIYRALHPDVPLQSLQDALPELVQWWKHSDEAKAIV
jgi:dTDP-4-dehydrorhamnose reductase